MRRFWKRDGFRDSMKMMGKKLTAFTALFLFVAVVFAAPVAEAARAAAPLHTHHAAHDCCPKPGPAKQAPVKGSGAPTCCSVSFAGFTVTDNMLGVFFAATLMVVTFTLFIPRGAHSTLFRPPKR